VKAINEEGTSVLLECIKECYPMCDLETFSQRVVSSCAEIALGARDVQCDQTAVTCSLMLKAL
jgi:hypothetical protein